MSLEDMPGQADRPDGYEAKDDVATCVRLRLCVDNPSANDKRNNREQESEAPQSVDVGVVLFPLTEEEKEGVAHEDNKHGDVKVGSGDWRL